MNLLDGSLSESGIVYSLEKNQRSTLSKAGASVSSDRINVYFFEYLEHDVKAGQTQTGSATISGYDELKGDLRISL